MRVTTLLDEAQREIQEEKEKEVKKLLKMRLREIEIAEKSLAVMTKQYEELLEKDINTVYDKHRGQNIL